MRQNRLTWVPRLRRYNFPTFYRQSSKEDFVLLLPHIRGGWCCLVFYVVWVGASERRQSPLLDVVIISIALERIQSLRGRIFGRRRRRQVVFRALGHQTPLPVESYISKEAAVEPKWFALVSSPNVRFSRNVCTFFTCHDFGITQITFGNCFPRG